MKMLILFLLSFNAHALTEVFLVEPPTVTKKYQANYFGDPEVVHGIYKQGNTIACDVKFWQETYQSATHSTYWPKFFRFKVTNVLDHQRMTCDVENRKIVARVYDKETLVRTHTWRFDREGRWVR